MKIIDAIQEYPTHIISHSFPRLLKKHVPSLDDKTDDFITVAWGHFIHMTEKTDASEFPEFVSYSVFVNFENWLNMPAYVLNIDT